MIQVIRVMRLIAEDALEFLRNCSEDVESKYFNLKDYHGFAKSAFPKIVTFEITRQYGWSADKVQLEIVKVSGNLTSQIHRHRFSTAMVIGLGKTEHFPNPRNARMYIQGRWEPFTNGQKDIIVAGEPHGFTVDGEGILYFLSVQTPPIENAENGDDYELVTT